MEKMESKTSVQTDQALVAYIALLLLLVTMMIIPKNNLHKRHKYFFSLLL
jgi:hypothetical protein